MYQITNGIMPYLDRWSRNLAAAVDETGVYTFFRYITELGSGEFTIPFVIVMGIVFLLLYRDYLPAVIFAAGSYGAHLLNLFIKDVLERARPGIVAGANAQGYSFPSGHAMIAMVCYGLFMYFISKKIRSNRIAMTVQVFFSVLIFLIGISRYFINVHYMTDVIAGFAFGYLLLVGVIYFYEWLQRKRYPAS